MIIYLADLSHTGHGRSPNTVPLAAGYLAAFSKKEFPDTEIQIFRDPEQLFAAVKVKPPDVLGISLYLWSERLACFAAQKIRELSAKTVIVAGGPSIDDIDEELTLFLQIHPYFDLCIPNQGEISFVRVIEHIKAYGKLAEDIIIDGCARLSSAGALLRGAYIAPLITDIPSPYLEGFLDSFLSDDYLPVIQSSRGCPYSCAFCVSGTPNWKNLNAFPLDRVIAEFEYIKERTKTKTIRLTDENLGIFKERDVELVQYIMKSYNESGFPELTSYTNKIITEYVLQIVELMSPFGEFCMSFQTLDENVRKLINRTNVTFDQFLQHVGWAKTKNILTSTEMIFGFPGETVNSYISGLEQLVRSGVNRTYSYNLRMFSGMDLATQKNRDKYQYKTKYRLAERTFGKYAGTVISEVEEIVVGTSTFNFDDYLTVRKYGLFLELASGRGYLSELIHLMIILGLPGEKLLRFFAEHQYKQFPSLSIIVQEYLDRATGELFDTPEQCCDTVSALIFEGGIIPEVKLNFLFTGKLMLNDAVRAELFEVIREFIHSFDNAKAIEILEDYLNNILDKQIVRFHAQEEHEIVTKSRLRLDKLNQTGVITVNDLLMDNFEQLSFILHKDTANFIQKKSISTTTPDDALLQDIFTSLPLHGLLRKLNSKPL